ncbi:MAG: nuclear transport factor 2 family protein [SAR202 cluster bacterium]|nr:nuclear transport factor 2 family protein [SAR202 cluster bacterium]
MPKSDLQKITDVAKTYYEGMIHGDPRKLKRAFHSKAVVSGLGAKGELVWRSRSSFIELCQGLPKPPKSGKGYAFEVTAIDIVNDIANVKVDDTVAGTTYTDYLTMLKRGPKWSIVNKTFHLHK